MYKATAISVFIVLTSALSGCGTNKEAYLARGNKLYEAGKYEDAALNYRKAAQKDPTFGEAYYRLGLASIKLNHGQEAYQSLFRAVQLEPGNTEVKEQFAGVCLSIYLAASSHPRALYTQLTTVADDLLSKNAKSDEGLIVKGYLASTDRKPKEAIEFFRKAVQVDSSNPGVVTELIQILIEDGQKSEAEELALNLIDHQKTSYGLIYDLMYVYYSEAGRNTEAQRVLETKVNNNPKRADYILQLAQHYRRLKNDAAMQAALHRLLDDPKSFAKGRLLVGNFYLSLRDYAEAIRYYQAGLDSRPAATDKGAYQRGTILALAGEGKKDEAARFAEQALKENPNDAEVMRLHAGLLLASGKRENADTAAREFQALSNRNPNDVSLRFELGKAYRLKGDLSAAQKEFLEAVHKQSDLIAARYEIADISLIENQPKLAMLQTNEILKAHPADRRARLLRTRALIGTGDVTAARTELLQLIKEFPQDLEPQLQLGFLALAERNYPEAIRILGQQREHGDALTFVGLSAAYLHEKQFDTARATLNEGLQKWPDSTTLLQQLADTEAVCGHYDLAVVYLERLLTLNPGSVELYRRLAEVSDLRGDWNSELRYAEEAHKLAPGDPAVTLVFAASLAQAGHTDEARTQYERAVKLSPEDAPALNNAAYFLADTGGDLDEALRLARRAFEKAPGQPDFSDTIGYIYLKKGLQESAIQTFKNLAKKYPSYAAGRYHLGLALYEKGDRKAARKELQAALASHPTAQDRMRIRELLGKIG